jgi:hypothetical protein
MAVIQLQVFYELNLSASSYELNLFATRCGRRTSVHSGPQFTLLCKYMSTNTDLNGRANLGAHQQFTSFARTQVQILT